MRTQIIFVVCVLLARACQAGTITVDDDGPADFNSIQAAIDYSTDSDTIVVQPGLYEENINFLGKNIALMSTNPTDTSIVKSTTIAGSVGFRGTEDANCIITGFDIDGCISGFDWLVDPYGKNHTHAAISHCILENIVTGCGRVIHGCDGTISNCTIANITYLCLRPAPVPAISACHGLFTNCTMVNAHDGIEILDAGTCTLQNCILRRSYPIIVAPEATLNVSYCNLQGGLSVIWGGGNVNWGPGNIDADPCFAQWGNWQVPGDYHLKSQAGRWDPNTQNWVRDRVTSICIDAGDPNTSIGWEPFPNGGRINMGASGGTREASKSYFGRPVCRKPIAGDINGDCRVDFKDVAILALHWLHDNNE
jgi:hypothetical protein